MQRSLLRMRPLLVVVLGTTAIAWLATAAPAPAAAGARGALVATPRFVPEFGPILAGERGLAWLTRRDDAVLDLWVSGPDQAPRRIQRFVGSDGERLRSPRLTASSTLVGLELFVTPAGSGRRDRRVRSRSYLGAFGQPLRPVASCANADPTARSIDVQEDAAIYRGPACSQVTVLPALDGAVAPPSAPGAVFDTRLAGTFEAWLEGPAGGGAPVAAVVRERAGGREVTRLAAATLPHAIVDQALRADGTLALLYGGTRDAARLALVDPGAVRPRTLPLTVHAPEGARWIGDALGVVAAQRSAAGVGVLQIVDAEGATTQRIVDLGRDRELWTHADVAAGRAVWVGHRCTSAEIRTIALPVRHAVVERGPPCRLRLVRRARLHGDRLRFGISCAGFGIACAARVTVRAGRHVIARGSARYNHSTPPHAAADLKLSPAGLRMLRDRRRTRVRIDARIADAAGPRTIHTVVVARR